MTNYESRPDKEESNPTTYGERFTEMVKSGEYRHAGDKLLEIAQPLLETPPESKWVELPLDGGEANPQLVGVPFTESEFRLIVAASLAHAELQRKGASMSGAARDYWGRSQFFPAAAKQLQRRDASVWGIMSAALAAEEMLITCKDSAWEPQGEELQWFTTVRDLPDALAALREEQ
jgi:hypothetical protein